MRWIWLVAALALCAGCPEGLFSDDDDIDIDDNDGDLNLRPDDAPDVLILSVSGHNLWFGLSPECTGTGYNCEYLLQRGTLDAIGQVFLNRGYGVEGWTHVDELYDQYEDIDGDGQEEIVDFGFLALLDEIDWVVENWIADFDNPTRVIVVAHSHGGVWAHSALMLRPSLPVDVLIDLDSNALCWEEDFACALNGDNWQSAINDYVDYYAPDWWFDVGDAGDSWLVPGLDALQDIEDVVPDSVLLNLEVHGSTLLAYDNQFNYRRDGSLTGLWANYFDESHRDITLPGSDAMQWVAESINAVYQWP